MGEEVKQTNEQDSAFSFGVSDQFKEQTNHRLSAFEQSIQSIEASVALKPKTEAEIRFQAINESVKGQSNFEKYDWASKLTKKGETSAKPEFKNPLSINVADGVAIQPIVKPGLNDKGKPEIKELGVKGNFHWGQASGEVKATSEFKNGEFQKAGVTVSGKF